MKVKDLVELLATMPPEMDVLQYSDDDDDFKPFIPGFPRVYDLDQGTRDFRAVTPTGTTQQFLCF